MAAITLALFTAIGFLVFDDTRDAMWQSAALLICLGGLALTGWSIYVMHRLWGWHEHWRQLLQQMESGFPRARGWVQPFSSAPGRLYTKPIARRWRRPAGTQPYLYAFLVTWTAILIALLSGVL